MLSHASTQLGTKTDVLVSLRLFKTTAWSTGCSARRMNIRGIVDEYPGPSVGPRTALSSKGTVDGLYLICI